jgi:hypothetical protein
MKAATSDCRELGYRWARRALTTQDVEILQPDWETVIVVSWDAIWTNHVSRPFGEGVLRACMEYAHKQNRALLENQDRLLANGSVDAWLSVGHGDQVSMTTPSEEP